MKHKSLIMVLGVAVALIGCQDNSMTSLSDLSDMPLTKAAINSDPDRIYAPIPFGTVLPDPTFPTRDPISIQGSIAFHMVRAKGPNEFDLSMSITAELTKLERDNVMMKVAEKTFDRVHVSEDGVTWLSKLLRVQGAPSELYLGIQVQVTQNHLEVINVWLTGPRALPAVDLP